MSRNFTAAENERQRKRNTSRKIDDIADYLMKRFSSDGEGSEVNYSTAMKAAQTITSEIFGFNTADLETPVDDEHAHKADDIIAQIRANQAAHQKQKDVTDVKKRDDVFKDIRKMANEIVATTPGGGQLPSVDAFDAAMSIVEKK